MTTNTYGIDGCKAGWVITHYNQKNIVVDISDTLFNFPFKPHAQIIIDMPVHCSKSLNDYPRKSDIDAKKKLGRWHSRVFYAPLTSWLSSDYLTINAECAQFQKPKLSKQSFNLFKKIAELQRFSNENSNLTIIESHPELVFQFLNQGIALESKKSKLAQQLRYTLLTKAFKNQNLLKTCPYRDCKLDDIYDAYSMLWVASHLEKNPFLHSLD